MTETFSAAAHPASRFDPDPYLEEEDSQIDFGGHDMHFHREVNPCKDHQTVNWTIWVRARYIWYEIKGVNENTAFKKKKKR